MDYRRFSKLIKSKIKILQKLYNFMNCVSGQKGQFLCINRNCEVRNCFVCSDPEDTCK